MDKKKENVLDNEVCVENESPGTPRKISSCIYDYSWLSTGDRLVKINVIYPVSTDGKTTFQKQRGRECKRAAEPTEEISNDEKV